jgi:hypothetical protein
MSATRAELEQALTSLKAMLGADGYELGVSTDEDGGTLRLEVGATANACADCLVPAGVIASVARSCLADSSISTEFEIDVRMPVGGGAST